MKKLFFISLLLIISTLTVRDSFSQKEGDRIIAIVGNEILLESDLQYQVVNYMKQNNIAKVTPTLVSQILLQMVNEMVIIAKADQDSIIIKPEEINKELEYRIKSLISQYGSEERIVQIYGMNLGQIKIVLKEDLEKKMKSDRMKRRRFPNGMHATEKEIIEFYKQYSDSIPPAPDEYELYHIFVLRKVTDEEKKSALSYAKLILDSLKAGANFETLAKRNSDDPGSAQKGGDLGWTKRGMFVKEFEDVAFGLQIGEISEPVETQYGFHIIQVLEKKGDQIKCRHILISVKKTETNDMATKQFLNDLKLRIENGEISFIKAAEMYSQGDDEKEKKGYLGFVSAGRLDSIAVAELNNLSPGGITNPIRVGNDKEYGYELLYLVKTIPSHKLTLETDYDKIKRYAEYFKENKEIDKWIEDLKKTIYVEIKL